MGQAVTTRIEQMHATHGPGPAGRTCGECAQCVDRRRSHPGRGSVTHYVCLAVPPRRSAHGEVFYRAWQKRWPACGKFQASEAVR